MDTREQALKLAQILRTRKHVNSLAPFIPVADALIASESQRASLCRALFAFAELPTNGADDSVGLDQEWPQPVTNRMILEARKACSGSAPIPCAEPSVNAEGLREPYVVEVIKGGCSDCGRGRRYMVVFKPEDVGGSTEYEDEECASDEADLCNDAFQKGMEYAPRTPAQPIPCTAPPTTDLLDGKKGSE